MGLSAKRSYSKKKVFWNNAWLHKQGHWTVTEIYRHHFSSCWRIRFRFDEHPESSNFLTENSKINLDIETWNRSCSRKIPKPQNHNNENLCRIDSSRKDESAADKPNAELNPTVHVFSPRSMEETDA